MKRLKTPLTRYKPMLVLELRVCYPIGEDNEANDTITLDNAKNAINDLIKEAALVDVAVISGTIIEPTIPARPAIPGKTTPIKIDR